MFKWKKRYFQLRKSIIESSIEIRKLQADNAILRDDSIKLQRDNLKIMQLLDKVTKLLDKLK